ncbi:MAG TPA: hypothetical protein VF765_05160 [Polyangiaceae bacterium]
MTRFNRFSLLAGFAIATVACGASPGDGSSDEVVGLTDAQLLATPPTHVMPTVAHARAQTAARKAHATPAFPAGAQLVYNGGKVNSSSTYLDVFWGSYWSGAGAATASHIDSFMSTVGPSPDFASVLEQYSTSTQTIGVGKYAGKVFVATDPPSTVDDTAIEAQIQSWIDAGTVPAASDNEVYSIAFPPGVTVTMQGSASCSAFCGYHSSFTTTSGATARYIVLPDPGCGGVAGCNFAATTDDSNTIILSHEMSEETTDPDVGLAISTNNNAYLGWYDNANGEIGDICAGDPDSSILGFAVQTEWSNADNACVATRTTTTTPDYSIMVVNPNATVAPGKRARFTLDSVATGGFTGAIKLWVAGLPPGATKSFSSALSGSGSTILRVTTSTTTPAGTYTITIHSASGTLRHDATASLTVN